MTWRIALVLAAILGGAALFFFGPARPSNDIGDRPLAPLPQGPLRIVAFGTSLTAKNDWPDALGPVLETCRGAPVEIRRVAKPGAGSAWALGDVDAVIAAAPDLVLLEFAINDAEIRKGAALATARETHDRILTALKAGLPEAQILLMTMNPAHGLRGLARPYLADHYAQYRALAESHGVGLLDLYPRWRAAPPEVPALRGRAPSERHPGPRRPAAGP